MSIHGVLSESSVSDHPVTHDRKGREGKGREVGHPSIRLTRGGTAGRTWMAADAAEAVSE